MRGPEARVSGLFFARSRETRRIAYEPGVDGHTTPRLKRVVWLGGAELAGAEKGTSREGARSKMGTRSQGRWNVAKRFATNGAKFRAEQIGAKPTAPLFTTLVDTLHGGARH
jgi:hypothetical protein